MVIENCYNSGIITAESDTGEICGGLNSIQILNCYNTGNVNGKATSFPGIGGIGGSSVSKNIIKNNYNTGNIILTNNSHKYIGGIIGIKSDTDVIENNYFLENTVNGENGVDLLDGTESKNVDEMKEIYNILGNKFKKDVNGWISNIILAVRYILKAK